MKAAHLFLVAHDRIPAAQWSRCARSLRKKVRETELPKFPECLGCTSTGNGTRHGKTGWTACNDGDEEERRTLLREVSLFGLL